MLEIKQGAFGYRARTGVRIVLENFDLTLSRGQLICLLGANGAGKTTIFKTILGHIPLLKGQITIDGTPLDSMDYKTKALKLAYVPQQHIPPFPYTVQQVVEMGRCAHVGAFASPSRRDRQCALDALKRLGMESMRDTVYTELSGGERQLVLIARALAQESEYLLLDEPTANLDYGNQTRVLREIGTLTDSGIGVCMILHDPEQALTMDRDVAVIVNRETAIHGSAREIVTADLLREIYGVPVEMHTWTASDGSPVQSIHTHIRGKEPIMESRFLVDGIMCPKCVAKVTKALMDVEGVEAVSVSESYETVTVSHTEHASAEAMKCAIEGIPERKFTVIG